MKAKPKKAKAVSPRVLWVGFLDGEPHVQVDPTTMGGARTLTCYVSKAAAKRAYADVRAVRLVFGPPHGPVAQP